ncbi:nuclear pore complex protein Nup107 [Bactrocera neohumeralis]|uniref:nuclear pore complex protein Nup107 n=1 Tax=Bactrocera tryoni TaxID=59916 RepID=UPI001A9765D1|nr:nuclear pore complex protein Nup107 [Bactrocera tryoni]XP_050338777.1 nuclear pore complex protein Nup107 [Bactrocera neohumeralis]
MSNSVLTTSKRSLVQIKPQTAKELYTHQSASPNELSISLLPNELSRVLDQPERQRSLNYSDTFFGNYNDTTCDVFNISDRSTLEENTKLFLLKEKTDSLFPQFQEVLQGRTNDSEVFDTIQNLIQTCAGVADELQKTFRENATMSKCQINNYKWLDQEINTWRLLFALYKDRIMVQAEDVGMDCNMPPLGGSEKEVIAQLYACNSTLREYQLMVDWLEACYNRKDSQPQVGHVTNRAVGWENTLFQLQNRRDVAFGTGVDIVKALDPDAPHRERRPLHALDEEDNLRLSRCIFAEIRQGRIDEAMTLCKYSGQTWRAAILEGWRLHEDPNYETQFNTREKQPIEGNPRRDIWKKCAWLMADCKKFDEYTRAIAGAFCGHLDSLKALLNVSWEDVLWAYLKVQIDIRVESEIRACCIKAYLPLPDTYWNSKMSLEQIFEELSVHKDAAVRDYNCSKVGIIQKYLILDNIGELLQIMRRWVEESNKSNDPRDSLSPHILRFITHIVLFMRQIGRVDKEETADFIVAAYVDCLIKMGDAQLVAFYTAALPGKFQMFLYSKFLEGITDTASRSAALTEAINAGLDVENITRYTVDNIRQRVPDIIEKAAMSDAKLKIGEISSFDQRKISALEWLTFLPTQRGELLWQANAMIRTFLGENKSECVRAVYEIVPTDSLSQIINIYGSNENFPCREQCSIKEYLSYKIYLTAIESFGEWSRLLHNRPKEPNVITAGANFTERVASEHKGQVYHADLKRWEANLEEQTKLTRDALFNILLFPEKGWLIDPDTSKDPVNINGLDWQNRQIQLEKLRSICIPEMVLLLHKVLHVSGDYQGCVKLSDEIASETRQLYKVYTKHKLAELLSKLSESSLQLLNKKLDPWGYVSTL